MEPTSEKRKVSRRLVIAVTVGIVGLCVVMCMCSAVARVLTQGGGNTTANGEQRMGEGTVPAMAAAEPAAALPDVTGPALGGAVADLTPTATSTVATPSDTPTATSTPAPSDTPTMTPTAGPPTETPTPAPPTETSTMTPTVALKDVVQAEVVKALGYRNRDGAPAPSVEVVEPITDQPGWVNVTFALNDNLTAGMIRTGARTDVMKIAKVVHDQTDGYGVQAFGTFEMQDVYGNSSEDVVLKVRLTPETLARINWKEYILLFDNLPQMAEFYWEHPALRE